MHREEKRPFDWMLDVFAPLLGILLTLTVVSSVVRIAGCE